ncbi:MAG: UDP-N-acetylmuramoyl-L-alanine--D-glutamate ligase [Treponemataceae bacterium]|nr:MAG: UDP-N-acetylmuramoyl-L-alanine--D-glutamate ligase [Treponemataceae bacterium]
MTPHVYPRGCAVRSADEIRGKRVTVMGVGLNKGGEESIRFFLKHGAFVTATDTKTEEQLLPAIRALREDESLDAGRLRFVLGKHDAADFESADIVIKNPVVKFEGNEFLERADAAGVPIETDISIFLSLAKSPVIAVTGSKGKSTTASAIHYGLTQAGIAAFLGGNITVSPLVFLEQVSEHTPVVLELSSWQLRDLRGRDALKPKIALITAIMNDHQNWYGSMADYVADKKLIYADQDSSDWTICARDSRGDEFAAETRAAVIRYDAEKIIREKDSPLAKNLLVPGAHNRLNVHNAALALGLTGVSMEQCAEIFSRWHGIPHRLEFFHSWNGIRFYNDTTATVPEAACAASQAFEQPVHLICGGTDKELDFAPLAETLAGKAIAGSASIMPASVYLLAGSGTDKLVPLLRERGVHFFGPFDSLDSLLSALKARLASAAPSAGAQAEIVVFSPGATSFGMFKNEFDRGDTFKQLVTECFAAGKPRL